jgi:hypothetical protein
MSEAEMDLCCLEKRDIMGTASGLAYDFRDDALWQLEVVEPVGDLGLLGLG